MQKLMFALLAGMFAAASAHAGIVVEKHNDAKYTVTIIGTVTLDDYAALTEKVSAIQANGRASTIAYLLNASGGSTEAALSIGRFLRDQRASAAVEAGDLCISSCVFMLAGAVNRNIDGLVILQKPDDLATANAPAHIRKMESDNLAGAIKAYLTETNVQPGLYDDMLRVPSGSVRVLSDASLVKYGLLLEGQPGRQARIDPD